MVGKWGGGMVGRWGWGGMVGRLGWGGGGVWLEGGGKGPVWLEGGSGGGGWHWGKRIEKQLSFENIRFENCRKHTFYSL